MQGPVLLTQQGELASRQAGISLAGNRSFPCQLKQAAPLEESLWPKASFEDAARWFIADVAGR